MYDIFRILGETILWKHPVLLYLSKQKKILMFRTCNFLQGHVKTWWNINADFDKESKRGKYSLFFSPLVRILSIKKFIQKSKSTNQCNWLLTKNAYWVNQSREVICAFLLPFEQNQSFRNSRLSYSWLREACQQSFVTDKKFQNIRIKNIPDKCLLSFEWILLAIFFQENGYYNPIFVKFKDSIRRL